MRKKIHLLFLALVILIGAFNLPKVSATSTGENPIKTNVVNPEYSINTVSPTEAVPVFKNEDKSTFDNTKREMRAVWIATVKNTNMPSKMNEETFRNWANEACTLLKNNNYNTVIFQIRPTGDAFYKSELNPWSPYITGLAQGTDPGYDPLQIMTDIAHKNGLELHGWINPFRVTMASEKLESLSPNNIASKNPSWLIKYGSQYYLDPGLPEVRDHLVKSVKEIVANYDIDAIHIDDYFYPYPISGETYNDSNSYNTYGGGANLSDWRRDNVTTLVRDLNKAIKETKSYVQFGISPFGVWRNAKTDPSGSNTNAGHECFDSLYADTRKWINEGIIDYITPQIYWSTAFEKANYSVLTSWWENEVKTQAKITPVNLYIGIADYKVNDNTDLKWGDVNEIPTQIEINRNTPAINGQMHYALNAVKANNLNYLKLVKETKYNNIAITPSTYWNDSVLPKEANTISAIKTDLGVKVSVSTDDASTRKYAIYRFEGAVSEYSDKSLVAVIYKNGTVTEFIDTTAISGKSYIYCVKSLSHTGVINNNAKSSTLLNY